MAKTADPYEQLPSHAKLKVDVANGATTEGEEGAPPLTREEQLLQDAYERHVLADRVVQEAVNTRVRLLQEETRLLAQIEIERQEAADEQALRDEAARLIEEATT